MDIVWSLLHLFVVWFAWVGCVLWFVLNCNLEQLLWHCWKVAWCCISHTKRSPGRDNCCWKVVKFWYQAEERRWTTIAFWRLTMKLFPSSTSASSRQAADEMVRDCWAKFWKQEGWWSDIEKLILITLMLTLIGVAMLLISAMTLVILVMLVLWWWFNVGLPREDLDLHQGGVSIAKCAQKVAPRQKISK